MRWKLVTNIRSVRVFFCQHDPVEEHISFVRHMHLCLRCAIHSASAKKVPVVIQVFPSVSVKRVAHLSQEVQGIMPVSS